MIKCQIIIKYLFYHWLDIEFHKMTVLCYDSNMKWKRTQAHGNFNDCMKYNDFSSVVVKTNHFRLCT